MDSAANRRGVSVRDCAKNTCFVTATGVYGNLFQDQMAAMNIEEVLSAPGSPWQNAYAERLIGSIRRDCLDHMIVFDKRSLKRLLQSYFDYYHRSRTDLSLEKHFVLRFLLTQISRMLPDVRTFVMHPRWGRRPKAKPRRFSMVGMRTR